MKKLLSILLALLLLAALTGCSKAPAPQQSVEGTPEEIIAKIYENHQPLKLNVISMELDLTDADAVAYNTGLESADKLSAVCVSEAMMGQAIPKQIFVEEQVFTPDMLTAELIAARAY